MDRSPFEWIAAPPPEAKAPQVSAAGVGGEGL
jgi:hypothetical protein